MRTKYDGNACKPPREHKVINIKLQKKNLRFWKKRQLYEISHQLLSFKNPIWSTQKAMFILEWTAYIKKLSEKK